MAGEWVKRKIGSLGRVVTGEYRDAPGFCKSATLEEIRKHGYVLTPGCYVSTLPQEDEGKPLEEKMKRLGTELRRSDSAGVVSSTNPSFTVEWRKHRSEEAPR